jgi:hypothetical protein
MSVRDDRLPPFAWLALDDLERIRRGLPPGRQGAARNALLALAEAASRRRDGRHRNGDGDTLRDLAGIAGVSERRLRDHLRDLAALDLIRVEEARDDAGRDLPTTYVLTGSDDLTDPPDATTARPDDPAPNRPTLNRAREAGKEREPSLESQRSRATREEGYPDLEDVAEHVRGVLQRGIDGLTTDERCRAPTAGVIRAALERFPVDAQTARLLAVEVRSIAQSQNRAPNIAGLYAQRLEALTAEETDGDRSQPALTG